MEQCSPAVTIVAGLARTAAAAGSDYYQDLGRKAGRGIITGIEAPKDQGCWSPITQAFIDPFEKGLRESLEPFIGKKVVVGAAGVLLLGGVLGWWLRGRR